LTGAPPSRTSPEPAVATEAELESWLSAFVAGWDVIDPDLQRVGRAAMGAWPGPPEWRRYLARVDGEPAGEALLTLFGDVAYLAEASTVPAYRRRGIQRALIAHRLEAAREAGATTVFGAVRYGDASWSNMRAMGLREEFLTLRLKRPAF
jgi:GNAT superfamily N-acetyltransferase